MRWMLARAIVLSDWILRGVLAFAFVAVIGCAALATPEMLNTIHRRIDDIATKGAQAGHSLVELVGAALLASGGGFAAGRASSSSGGRRRSDPPERPT